jgi:cytochrome c oxidase subunit 2
MVDPSLVLQGQTIAYTLYVIAILLLMAWFGYQVTRGSNVSSIKPLFFYSFVGFLVFIGVSLHLVTHETIPWKPIDLNRGDYQADKVFDINVKDHHFYLPSDTLVIKTGDLVHFKVTSEDLTYGFGLFRQDNTMLFQMQVVPGHMNDIMWKFEKPEILTIRSTEYSGWKSDKMILKDVVQVK